MDKKLEQLVRKAALLAKQKFEQNGDLPPFFYARTDEGKRLIFDPAALGILGENYDAMEKQTIANCAEMLFALHHVHRYVHIAEAWMLATDIGGATKEEIEEVLKAAKVSIAHHPKRMEVITYEAEDVEGNRISGRQSIIRPAGQKPYLDDDLELHDAKEWETTGRFTHLLDFRKYYDQRRSK